MPSYLSDNYLLAGSMFKPSATEVQAHLEKVLHSKVFASTRRLQALLRYLVLNMLAGYNEELSEYRLAFEVFKRKESFDPSIDPIVRVETSRLRSRLKAYLAHEGKDDTMEFELPSGSYRLQIRERPAPERQMHEGIFQVEAELAIAVLPLLNLSGGKKSEIFGHGLLEELITMVMSEPRLRVAARTSVCQFTDFKGDLRETARHLGVNFLLEGSLRQSGSILRVSMRLIDSGSGLAHPLGIYEREMQDALAMHQDISRSIVADLKAQLAQIQLEARSNGHAPQNGRVVIETIQHTFCESMERNCGYATALAQTAKSYVLLALVHSWRPNEVLKIAAAASESAFALDRSSVATRVAAGMVQLYLHRDFAEARKQFDEALALAPVDRDALNWSAHHSLLINRPHEALAHIQQALDLEPGSLMARLNLAATRYLLCDYQESASIAAEIIRLHSQSFWGYWLLGQLQVYQFFDERGCRCLEMAAKRSGENAIVLATLGNIYGKLRRYNQARAVLRKLMRDSMTKYVPPLALAALYFGLEEDDNALKWLEKAKQTKDIYLVYTNIMPIFTDLRERLKIA